MKLRPLQALAIAIATLGIAAGPCSAANYTLELVDNSGLDSSKYTIYAMGFSTASNLVMNASGKFVAQSTGPIRSYPVGYGGLTEILLDTNTAFTGGRIYFFVVPASAAAPSVAFGKQPLNPPGGNIYSIVEVTVPVGTPATMDVQTVDGFVFPLSLTLNGQTNVPSKQFGQPIYPLSQSALVNRASVFSAYNSFMSAEGANGVPYLDMVYGSFAGQSAGILNPGAYVTAINSLNEYINLDSDLNTEFNTALGTLFGTSTLKIQGVASAIGDSGTAIAADTYHVSSTGSQMYPGTSVMLPALQFTGDTVNTNVFTVFNPVGVAILTDTMGNGITGTVNGNTLTLDTAVSGLGNNMYVVGAGLANNNGLSATQISNVAGNVITLTGGPYGQPAAHSQYQFCMLPQIVMFQTPGQMVFANSGVFADNTIQYAQGSAQATVLGNLEYQLVAALNRGVALNANALAPVSNGDTSKYWGDQRLWYPAGVTQNLFSLFMHVGAVGSTPIFLQPSGASSWQNARNQTMGSAYGFAFDENGGPVPPTPSGQPEVPSKFDQNVPIGATLQITFGPWNATNSGGANINLAKRDLKILQGDLKRAKRLPAGPNKNATIKQLKFAQTVAKSMIADPFNSARAALLKRVMQATKVKNEKVRARKFKVLERQFKRLK
jgi:hypothetical protein